MTRRAALLLGALLLGAALPVVAGPAAPAEAAACELVIPSVVGSGRDRAVVRFFGCQEERSLTGYRISAFRNASPTAETTVDAGLDDDAIEVGGLTAGSIYRFRVQSLDDDVVGPMSGGTDQALPPFDLLSSFTNRQYGDFTGATATSAQRAAWKASVGGVPQTLTPVAAIDSLQTGPYWQVRSPVIRLFQAYFLRLPDLGGLDHWVGASRSGQRIGVISQKFARSSEFKGRYGALSNRAFVELVYQNVLGRPGDAAGIASWTKKLDTKARDRGSVMVGFSESNEYRTRTAAVVDVVNVFTGMLRRVPTVAEETTWTGQPRAALIAALLGTAEYEARVGVVAPPFVTTRTIPEAVVGKPYPATQLTSVFGKAPLTWRLRPGFAKLPPGLTLSKAGVLAGTPTTRGRFAFGVEVIDADLKIGTFGYDVLIQDLDITSPATLPDANVAVPYLHRLTAAGATGAVTWDSSSEPLPTGLDLEPDGDLVGTPSATGTWSFFVTARDTAGHSAERRFTVTVTLPAAPVVTTSSVGNGEIGLPFRSRLTSVGGSGTVTWSLASGALPAGLGLDPATGVISGTPTETGTAPFTVRATDAVGGTGDLAATIVVTTPTEWGQSGRTAERRGWSPDEASLTPTEAAKVGLEWRTGTAPRAIAVAAGVVYSVGNRSGDTGSRALLAHSITEGTETWRVDLDPVACDPTDLALTADAVVVGCGPGEARAYRRAAPHDLLWDAASTDPGSTSQHVLVLGTTVVAWSPTRAAVHDLATGALLHAAPAPDGATIVDAAASGNRLVLARSDGLVGIDLTTGTAAWSAPTVVTRKVVLADGWAYVDDDGGVRQLALADGAAGWTVPTGTGIERVVAVDGDTAYAWQWSLDQGGNRSSILRALRTSDGSQRWQASFWNRLTAVAVAGDVVWATLWTEEPYGYTSQLQALRRSDGAVVLARDHGTAGGNVLAVANGRVVERVNGDLWVLGRSLAPPSVTTAALPSGRVGTPFTATLAGTAGTWSIASGALPAGLSLSAAGVLAGTPTAGGTPTVGFRVTSADGRSRTRELVVQVATPGPAPWTTAGSGAGRNARNLGESSIGLATTNAIGSRWVTGAVANPSARVTDREGEPVVVGARLYATAVDGTLRAWDTGGAAADRPAAWQATAEAGRYFASSPTEVDGTLYLVDDANSIYAVRAADGVRQWVRTLPAATPPAPGDLHAPLVVGGAVTVLDGAARVWSVQAADGTPRWSGAPTDVTDAAIAPNTLLASDGLRAFALVGCRLHAVDLATGTEVWAADVPADGTEDCNRSHDRIVGDPVPGHTTIGAPVVVDGTVYAGGFTGTAAFDAATGAVRWRSTMGSAFGGTVSNGLLVTARVRREFADTWAYGFGALDAATGARVAGYGTEHLASSPTVVGDLAIFRTAYGVTSFRVTDGSTSSQWWTNALDGQAHPRQGRVVVSGGRAYVATDVGTIRTYATS